jgi:hypothetical protein
VILRTEKRGAAAMTSLDVILVQDFVDLTRKEKDREMGGWYLYLL